MMGAIPIVVGHEGWMDEINVRKSHEFFFENNFLTCVLTDVKKYQNDLLLLENSDIINQMLTNISNMDLTQFTSNFQIKQIHDLIINQK
jgi:hypothetical protein